MVEAIVKPFKLDEVKDARSPRSASRVMTVEGSQRLWPPKGPH